MAKPKSEQTIIFSGRFDRPHLGHIETITKLGREYARVIVVILKYEDQRYPICYRYERMLAILDRCKGNYDVRVNQTHFAEITREDLDCYDADVYGAGNVEVLRHIESLGYPCVFLDRSDEDAASDDWKYQQIRGLVNNG